MNQAWASAHADFLSSLSAEESSALLAQAKTVELEQRDMLFEAGDRSDNVFIVDTGCIKLFQISPAGKETILWFGFHGELFGIAELWSGVERELYAMANEPARIYSISQANFLEFLRQHPEAAMRAIGILSARVRLLGQALVDLATDDVETRIARLLLRFAGVTFQLPCQTPRQDGEICVNVRLTHQDIANLIGASRQTVTTVLANLRKQGTLRAVGHHIHILQPTRLRKMTHLDVL